MIPRILRTALAAALILAALPASALATGPSGTITPPNSATGLSDTVTNISVSNGTNGDTVDLYARVQASPQNSWICVANGIATITGGSAGPLNQTVSDLATLLLAQAPSTTSTIEWAVAEDSAACTVGQTGSGTIVVTGTSSYAGPTASASPPTFVRDEAGANPPFNVTIPWTVATNSSSGGNLLIWARNGTSGTWKCVGDS